MTRDFGDLKPCKCNLKYSKRHLTKRKQFYKEQGFRFQVTKVDYK